MKRILCVLNFNAVIPLYVGRTLGRDLGYKGDNTGKYEAVYNEQFR